MENKTLILETESTFVEEPKVRLQNTVENKEEKANVINDVSLDKELSESESQTIIDKIEDITKNKNINIDSLILSIKKKSLEDLQKINCEKTFEELQKSHFNTCLNYCEESISNARDAGVMRAELIERLDKTLPDFETLPFALKNGLECFISHYYTNNQFERAFYIMAGNFYEIFFDEIPETAHEYLLPLPFNQREMEVLNQYPVDMIQFISLALRKIVYAEVLKQLKDPNASKKEISPKNNAFKWNITKNNKTEFVQLFYALHKAGYLEGEITKIIEASAQFFNVELSEHWQSNHSSHIHKFKKDHPPIFDNLKTSYKEYSDKQQNIAPKNTASKKEK